MCKYRCSLNAYTADPSITAKIYKVTKMSKNLTDSSGGGVAQPNSQRAENIAC